MSGMAIEELHRKMMSEVYEGGVRDTRVLGAMNGLERHRFVPSRVRHLSYENSALEIDEGQSISQPLMVGLMTQELEVEDENLVFEVGTGSGYQAAILSKLCRRVYTVERHKDLYTDADKLFLELGLSNIVTLYGDGMEGSWHGGPEVFDRIMVTASAQDEIPPKLLSCLKEGGLMVIPVGEEGEVQSLLKVRKGKDGLDVETLADVRFVPLLSGKG